MSYTIYCTSSLAAIQHKRTIVASILKWVFLKCQFSKLMPLKPAFTRNCGKKHVDTKHLFLTILQVFKIKCLQFWMEAEMLSQFYLHNCMWYVIFIMISLSMYCHIQIRLLDTAPNMIFYSKKSVNSKILAFEQYCIIFNIKI